MKIVTLHTTMLETGTYVVINDGRAFVVDPGADAGRIIAAAEAEGAKIEWVLLTHAHFDHIGAAAALQREGAQIVLHRDDVKLIKSFQSLSVLAGVKVEHFTPDVTVAGGETLDVAGVSVKVIHTPGHTAGSVCYVAGDVIFSGDTLFALSYGRTDFPTGSFAQLKNSIINKLFALEGDYKVLPGHEGPTTLDYERAHNPILTD